MDLTTVTMSSSLTPTGDSSLCRPNFSQESVRNETVEKFINLCRSRLVDSPNRRKRRFSCLRKHVTRYSQSRLWNQSTFDALIAKFSNLMVNEMVPDQASVIYDRLLSELQNLTGKNCSTKVTRKKATKHKVKRNVTVAKLEKSLASVQRKIIGLKSESSSSTAWQARDGKALKLHSLQKRALRLTKKINEMNSISSHNQMMGHVDVPDNAVSRRIGNEDLGELENLLKSVKLRDPVKIRRIGNEDLAELGNLLKSVKLRDPVKIRHLRRFRKRHSSRYHIDRSQTSQSQASQTDDIPCNNM